MTRVALYARYSSDRQRETSIEDQLRLCRERAAREGWTIAETYSDYATSGSNLHRPGIRALMEDARAHAFDLVLAESLDRISRDQEDIAHVFKRLAFVGIRIVTLSEGEVSELHIGLKGTMGALYLKDLADKVRRGHRGLVENGRVAGGKCYGYRVVPTTASRHEVRGERVIDENEAAVVRRIFEEFAAGRSPRAIAADLNREGISAPRGKQGWSPSTIHGHRGRGTGILNNELYRGVVVWNRQKFIKDPDTGKRQARPNPPEEWIRSQVAALRIIPQELWTRVKERQGSYTRRRPEQARRPVHLLSGLLTCGACGGGFSKISRHHYGCSRARNNATCDNRLTIRQDVIEGLVLDGLRRHLMQPKAVKAFVEEFTREMNRLAAERDRRRAWLEAEQAKVERETARLIQALKDGVPAAAVRDELAALEERKAAIAAELAAAPPPTPTLHPNLSELYRRRVEALQAALQEPERAREAAEALRGLIDRVRLVPEDGRLRVELEGSRAALLALGSPEKRHPRPGGAGVQATLVAGVGFEPTTFRL